ncbi:hypothetical protein EBZ37_13615, partial [bacterium]|nr:hypothetical protein [bacterium]
MTESFGIWASPQDRAITLGRIQHLSSIPPRAHEAGWFSPRFFDRASNTPWHIASEVQKLSRPDAEAFLTAWTPRRPSWKPTLLGTEEEHFKDRVSDVLHKIAQGTLKKAVPIAFLNAAPPFRVSREELAWILLHALRFQEKNGGYLYGLWNDQDGLIGVTPELLFSKTSTHIQTMALAGTRSIGDAPREKIIQDLLNDPKERNEHLVVIQGIQDKLMPLGEPNIGQTTTKDAGSLVHLFTPIELKLSQEKPLPFDELVGRLHPTPALGAFPEAPGKIWLESQDSSQDRSRFGAAFGFSHFHESTCVVAIRNLEWSQSRGFCRIGAGAGVVSQSQPDLEWKEIQRKWTNVLQILG